MDEQTKAMFDSFEALGEAEVKHRVTSGRTYNERNTGLANSWLQSKEDERERSREAAAAAHLEAAKTQAAAAVSQADAASSQARAAREANSIARAAIAIAIAAAIISVIALFRNP